MDDGSTTTGGRLAAVLLTLAVAALVVTHGLWQVTAPAPAGRLLRAVLPPLTDLDQTLAANIETLREVARGQPEDGRVTVPGLPIPVQVTREEADAEPDVLRATVLRRMSDAVYSQGAAAFRLPEAAPPDPTIFSSQWTLRQTLDFLTMQRHDSLRLPRLVAGIGTLVLALLTVWLLEGPARLSGPAVSMIVGSVIGGLAALGMRAVVILFYGADTVGDTIVRQVARDASTTVLFVAGTFLAFGVVVAALGALAGRVDRASPPAPRQRSPGASGRGRE